jgi:putative endonuclease
VSFSRAAGQAAEKRAAAFLEQRGYRIVARNYSCRMGEIDIVAEDGKTLCFVEVRMRRVDDFGSAQETITPQKLTKIVRAARHFLITKNLEQRECRFDVVTIQGDEQPRLAKDAFQADY